MLNLFLLHPLFNAQAYQLKLFVCFFYAFRCKLQYTLTEFPLIEKLDGPAHEIVLHRYAL